MKSGFVPCADIQITIHHSFGTSWKYALMRIVTPVLHQMQRRRRQRGRQLRVSSRAQLCKMHTAVNGIAWEAVNLLKLCCFRIYKTLSLL